jgi:hypothetical protein
MNKARKRSPVRGMLRRNRSADNDVLPMQNVPLTPKQQQQHTNMNITRKRSPMRGMLRRNRSADNDVLPMQNIPRNYKSGDDEVGTRSPRPRSTSAPRRGRTNSGSSGDISLQDLRDDKYHPTSKDKKNSDHRRRLPQLLIVLLLLVGVISLARSTEHTPSNVRGIYCPMDQPEPYTQCSLPAGTDCPFQCIHMPIYDKTGQCTGEVVCKPEKRCTCENSRDGEWFCFGGGTYKEKECRKKNYYTYQPCTCPRTLAVRQS